MQLKDVRLQLASSSFQPPGVTDSRVAHLAGHVREAYFSQFAENFDVVALAERAVIGWPVTVTNKINRFVELLSLMEACGRHRCSQLAQVQRVQLHIAKGGAPF